MQPSPRDHPSTTQQTHGTQLVASAGGGAWGEAVAFARVGKQMVLKAGPGALFVGIVPRLVQQVRTAGLD